MGPCEELQPYLWGEWTEGMKSHLFLPAVCPAHPLALGRTGQLARSCTHFPGSISGPTGLHGNLFPPWLCSVPTYHEALGVCHFTLQLPPRPGLSVLSPGSLSTGLGVTKATRGPRALRS